MKITYDPPNSKKIPIPAANYEASVCPLQKSLNQRTMTDLLATEELLGVSILIAKSRCRIFQRFNTNVNHQYIPVIEREESILCSQSFLRFS